MGLLARHIQRLERMVLLPTGELLVIRLIDRFEARDSPPAVAHTGFTKRPSRRAYPDCYGVD